VNISGIGEKVCAEKTEYFIGQKSPKRKQDAGVFPPGFRGKPIKGQKEAWKSKIQEKGSLVER